MLHKTHTDKTLGYCIVKIPSEFINTSLIWWSQIWKFQFCSSSILSFLSWITQNYRVYANILHIKWLLYYPRCSFSGYGRSTYLYWRSTYQTTALLSELSILWVRAAYNLWLLSYGSKHTLQSLSNMSFVHIFMHNLKTTGRIWMFDCHISNNYFTIRDIPFVV